MRIIKLLSFVIMAGCAEAQTGLFIADRNVPVTYVSGFANTTPDRYYSGDGTGPQANSTAFTAWVIVVPVKNETTNNWQFIFGNSNRITNQVGWGFTQFQGGYSFNVGAQWAGNAGAPKSYQLLGNSYYELNYMQVLHGVVRDGYIYLYKNGKVSGTGVQITDGSFISSSRGVSIGSFPSTTTTDYAFYEGKVISAGIASSTALSDAQVEAHYQAILSNVNAIPTGATHLWRGSDAGATWTDNIASLSLTRYGSVTSTAASYAFYKRFDPYLDYSAVDPILPPLTGTIKVMCIGDSRTIGGHVSYRYIAYT